MPIPRTIARINRRFTIKYIIALTYTADSDWVKNVLAAGLCDFQTRGRRMQLVNPHITTDRTNRWAPLPVRLILNTIGVTQNMRLTQAVPNTNS